MDHLPHRDQGAVPLCRPDFDLYSLTVLHSMHQLTKVVLKGMQQNWRRSQNHAEAQHEGSSAQALGTGGVAQVAALAAALPNCAVTWS